MIYDNHNNTTTNYIDNNVNNDNNNNNNTNDNNDNSQGCRRGLWALPAHRRPRRAQQAL